ncbi:hypothetical protein JNK13_04830 [bacterium]|nr:hypothetical protein [bacterium]
MVKLTFFRHCDPFGYTQDKLRVAMMAVAILSWSCYAQFSGAQTALTPAIENLEESSDVEQLIEQAAELFVAKRPIDARNKLLKAAEVAPNDFRPQMYLGEYYLAQVGHFRLALKYLKNAEQIFNALYSDGKGNIKNPERWKDHANLLYLLAEGFLNLDQYQKSLEIIENFESRYWRDSLPGTKAWVLLKLKRVDEAIKVAQAGILRGAEPGRTFNILGILFSVKDTRELSLDAFAQALEAEKALGSLGQPATPLNNAGEVYRELFRDEEAEGAWRNALSFSDGCEHILPSLNSAILFTDELRLLQAKRALNDFEACFKAQGDKADTEHRGLIALQRGRIALHSGQLDQALAEIEKAREREQWFGKIGTNENDLRFAATIAAAQVNRDYLAASKDRAYPSISSWAYAFVENMERRLRSWWLFRRARTIAIEELEDFEDLSIRNTDSMLEYPTLGELTAGFPRRAFARRIARIEDLDKRAQAKIYYRFYLLMNEIAHGKTARAEEKLTEILNQLRPFDRLMRATVIAQIIKVRKDSRWFGHFPDTSDYPLVEQLFLLAPASIRSLDLKLPVRVLIPEKSSDLLETLVSKITSRRFIKQNENSRFDLRFSESSGDQDIILTVQLEDRQAGRVLVSVADTVQDTRADRARFINNALEEIFSHKTDPASREQLL